ncbi:dynein intermediate chain 2, ciliary isoform X2 [Aphidius gifuensis]|uniref:dynein intermediate chain 2, ciliary isoform X2 n=1 Tax=Aphidius gifuensis TaxID=684658 RepID=UPI001CDC015E|nr:dynein intermediate chain 2, ciliary isoform X2 [Aphidius gifuensis]
MDVSKKKRLLSPWVTCNQKNYFKSNNWLKIIIIMGDESQLAKTRTTSLKSFTKKMTAMPGSGKKSSKISETSRDQLSITKSRASRVDLGGGGDMDWLRGKIFLKPEDQLQLTEAELQEEYARVLTMNDTRVPDSLVEWSWKKMEFVKLPKPKNIVNILSVPGTLLHRDSEEAKKQMAGHCLAAEEPIEKPVQVEDIPVTEEDEEEDVEEAEDGGDEKQADGTGEPEVEAEEEDMGLKKPKKVPNQFNFCERATLTYNNPIRDMSTQTVPPPTASFNSHVFQWTIFDDYQDDYAKQQIEREKERKLPAVQTKKDDNFKKKAQADAIAVTQRMLQAAKTLERMVNQNIFDEIAQDYRYWNDPSDEFKDGEGSLLPLWKFQYDKTKKHDVTDLCFNARYYDLFAVAFGTMSFNSSITTGSVCLFSLKNPSYPEWICMTESPVMSLDFSKQHPHLLVIGLKDGTVAVYNIMLPPTSPQYKSDDVSQKHRGIVWEVRWAPDTDEGNLTFYSVSIDGKINHWTLNQNELGHTTIMTLYLDRPPIPGPDGTLITLKDPELFLVGTEEGTIYKCNTAFSSVYMMTYDEAHHMPVYRIVFNNFNSSIFASCSGDWRIKIWEDNRLEPLYMFDLGVPIGDVQWAPYSSTVFACVSDDGRVTVFDLNVNKYRPICSQPIVSKKRCKLTRLAFNRELPFIIVGDDKGTINTLKLSPNLRVKVKPTKKQMQMSHAELESMKLEKLLSFVREPAVLVPPPDVKVSSSS